MEKPSATLCNGKYNVLNDFRYAEFLAYYTREDKSYLTCENYSDVLDDNLIESNHEQYSYPKKQILADDEIAEGINPLNLQQREVVNVVYTCKQC